jgi:hypothetical protein
MAKTYQIVCRKATIIPIDHLSVTVEVMDPDESYSEMAPAKDYQSLQATVEDLQDRYDRLEEENEMLRTHERKIT